eukprot:jgi/Ulvmu1/4540/UM002_0266.1
MRTAPCGSQMGANWLSSRWQMGCQRRTLLPTHATPDVLPAARALEQWSNAPQAEPGRSTPMVPPDPATPNPFMPSADAFSAALESVVDSDNPHFPTGKDSPSYMESLRINTRLIQAASLQELSFMLNEELPAIEVCELGCVNLSSSFYHATRLWLDGVKQMREVARDDGRHDIREVIIAERATQLNPVLAQLRPQLLRLHERAIVQPYDIAISLWSMATLDLEDGPLFEELSQLALSKVHRLNATDMAMAMWACARMRVTSDPLCEHLTTAAIRRIADFKSCELSMFVWGMCRTKQYCPDILRAAALRMMEAPADFAADELVRLLWSFSRLHWHEARELGVHQSVVIELARPERIVKLVPQDFANVMWALARMHVRVGPRELDALAEAAAAQLPRFKEQEVANLVYGYGAQRHQHDGLLSAAAAELLLRRERFQDQELAMFLWAVGMLGTAPGGELFLSAVEKETQGRAHRLKPLGISNTMKAFAKLRHLPQAEFIDCMSEAAVAIMDDFSMAELSNLLWAYSQLGWVDEELFEAAEEHMMDNMHHCTKHHILSVLNSFKASGHLCHRLVTVARNHGFYV